MLINKEIRFTLKQHSFTFKTYILLEDDKTISQCRNKSIEVTCQSLYVAEIYEINTSNDIIKALFRYNVFCETSGRDIDYIYNELKSMMSL